MTMVTRINTVIFDIFWAIIKGPPYLYITVI